MLMRENTLENQTLELRPGKLTGLGPRLVLHNSRIECYVTARELMITDVEMHHCTFVAKKQLTGFKFLRARLYDCAFEGRYSGCDFGKQKDVYNEAGDIARCDFSKARLDACRFFGCDIDTINLKTCFASIVMLQPRTRLTINGLGPLPIGLQVYLDVSQDQSPDCVAVVDDVELLANRLRVDPKELLRLAEEVGARSQSF